MKSYQDIAVRWVAVTLLFVAFGINALTTRHTQNEIRQNEVAGCYGNTARQVKQLAFDWTVYTADVAAGRTSGIRATEATGLLLDMKAIAAVRISVTAASLLPEPLAVVVRRADFHCP